MAALCKAKVEVAVQIPDQVSGTSRFVLAKLRNHCFCSLAELNVAIRACVAAINAKVMRKVGNSRAELLETLDRPALSALPETPYSYADWKRARVAPDYHIEIAGHYYSVPSKLIREIADARITSATSRSSIRASGLPAMSTRRCAAGIRRHPSTCQARVMPKACGARRRYAEWTPAKMMGEAALIGPATVALFEAIMKAKPHPEHCRRGLPRRQQAGASAPASASSGSDAVMALRALEAASERGNTIGATSYGSIASILKHGLDKAFAQKTAPATPPIRHGDIRGSGYFH